MSSKQGLFLEQQTKLIMTPQLYQAIEILQLPILELVSYVNNELNENPLLEDAEEAKDVEETKGAEEAKGVDEVTEQIEEENKVDQIVNGILQEEKDYWATASTISTETETSRFECPFLDNCSLQEYLMEQLRFIKHDTRIPNKLFQTAEYLIGNLDNNGYLASEVQDLADSLKTSVHDILSALSLVQQLDPAGVGARNLKECLALQFPLIPGHPPQLKDMLDYLDDLASGHYNKIAAALNVTVKEVKHMGELLRLLDPKPGSRYSRNNTFKYIIPDAIITKNDDEYSVIVNERDIPKIYINDAYRKALLGHEDEELKKYVRQKITSAINLMKSIELRKITIQEVLEAIVKHQKDFLDEGVTALKPLTMKELAEELNIHESTVSRVCANKYVQTPRGLYSVKCFFAGSIGRKQEVTPGQIKEDIKKYIAQENPCKPLSDKDLADILYKTGIVISRRTIAKYRDELGIPSTTLRRKPTK